MTDPEYVEFMDELASWANSCSAAKSEELNRGS